MPNWVAIAETSQITADAGLTAFVDELEVAVFRTPEGWRAIEGRCPHKGASLGNGMVSHGCVSCPWHGWQFQLHDGQAVGQPNVSVAPLSVREVDGRIEIDRESLPRRDAMDSSVSGDGIHRFLIRYGALGWVGRFGTVKGVECRFRDRVVVQTERGVELGEVLADSSDGVAVANGKPTGEVLRLATDEEVRQFTQRRREVLAVLISQAVTTLADATLPLEIVDGDLLFDGESAVLYFLGESHPDAGPLVTEVARQHGLERIELCSMVDPPTGGCGSCGCGEGGGGCSA